MSFSLSEILIHQAQSRLEMQSHHDGLATYKLEAGKIGCVSHNNENTVDTKI